MKKGYGYDVLDGSYVGLALLADTRPYTTLSGQRLDGPLFVLGLVDPATWDGTLSIDGTGFMVDECFGGLHTHVSQTFLPMRRDYENFIHIFENIHSNREFVDYKALFDLHFGRL